MSGRLPVSYTHLDVYKRQSFGRAAVRAVEYAEKCGFRREQINLGLPYYGRPTYKGDVYKRQEYGSAPMPSP